MYIAAHEYEDRFASYKNKIEITCGRLTYPNVESRVLNDGMVRCFHAHIHEAVEVIAVTRGVLHYRAGEQTFDAHPGDVAVFEPFELHEGFTDSQGEPLEYYVVIFEPRFFQLRNECELSKALSRILLSELHLKPHMESSHPSAARIGELCRQVSESFYSCSRSVIEDGIIIGSVYELIGLLVAAQDGEPSDSPSGRSISFISTVMRYIRENYDQPISTENICTALNYNKSHFCHRFRVSFGCSFIDYLNRYRILQATRNQSNVNRSISEIAASVGFTDCCYFTRIFKRCMGIPPSQYFATR